MTTLTKFLLARIAEDEAVAQMRGERESRDPAPESAMAATYGRTHFVADPTSPARVLAECEAKRRIVERAYDERGLRGELLDRILEDLASVYADHPDYHAEWA